MDLIREIENKPLSFEDLKKMLGPDAEVTDLIKYDDLAKITDLRDLFKGKIKAVIILLQIESPNAPAVGHWIAMLDQGDHYEHFDSYGLSADEELALTHEAPFLTKLINSADKRVEDSQARLQAIREHVNTCGRWAVARVKLRGVRLRDFTSMFQESHTVPDVLVSFMTLLL